MHRNVSITTLEKLHNAHQIANYKRQAQNPQNNYMLIPREPWRLLGSAETSIEVECEDSEEEEDAGLEDKPSKYNMGTSLICRMIVAGSQDRACQLTRETNDISKDEERRQPF